MKVSIMQPAFLPPASYFRLFAASDLFVILDTVQFNRRWYTHRQMLMTNDGTSDWLTLPIKKASRDTTMIKDLEWASNYQQTWSKEIRRFEVMEQGQIQEPTPLMFVCNSLFNTCNVLGIPLKVGIASQIPIDPNLRGQDRILAICEQVKATEYINSPGGKELYNAIDFADKGISLRFLPEWTGSYSSVIERIANGELPEDIRKEIYENL
jgi:hypothetical protein